MEQTGHLNNDFRLCLKHLMDHGYTANPRGTTSKEILNYNITLTNPRNRVITFKDRNVKTEYLMGELIWYTSGEDTLDGILPYSKFWANITNSGSEHQYDANTVNSNYGNRLFGVTKLAAFSGMNQWNNTINILKNDKDSRQALMNIHVPSDRHTGNKDVPCTIALQWFIRDNKLSLITYMRSNDIILGFTNDVFQFTMLQEAMMVNLREFYPDLELGYYYHNAGSMHVYDRHFEMADKIINAENAFDMNMIPMDKFNLDIVNALVSVECEWRNNHVKFENTVDWEQLTPYWQLCMKAFMEKDEEAMHQIFGIED
jgi:thymidylate synthase